jgi:photosystem II stability/assembly factor-like uncharacterized protein
MKIRSHYSVYRFFISLCICLLVSFPFYGLTQTWTTLTNLPTSDGLKTVHFIDQLNGWVAGANGVIFRTVDGGASWTSLPSNTSETIRGIFFFDQNNGWACGDNGTILGTIDGGGSWQPQSSGATSQLNEIQFVSTSTGWVVGNSNQLFKTTDGGSSWIPQTNQGGAMKGLYMLDAFNGWASSDYNSVKSGVRLVKTTNGTSWSNFYNSGISSLSTLNDIYFSDTNTGWVVGTGGIIRKTTDAGATTWAGQNSNTTLELLGVDFIDNTTGYACGRSGIILNTINGGTSWQAQYSGHSSGTIWEIDMIDATTGFAVGDMGVIQYSVSSPAQPIVLLQPNGGEVFQIGTKYNIIWQVQPGITNVKIEYSIDAGANWLPIVSSTPAGNGSYAWNVPNNPSVNCLIRISDVSNSAVNSTNSTAFYIMNSPLGVDYSVLTSATVSQGPDQITVEWNIDPNALSYSLDRKLPADIGWANLATLAATASNFLDVNVTPGTIYEYRLTKTTPLVTGYGYVYSGIDIPAIDNRGTVLLAVDDAFSTSIKPELDQYILDLIGDGWKVIQKDFPNTTTDVTLKNWVVSQYVVTSLNVKALLIIGHFAIPYSGNYAPDGHNERIGAQPADVFYADMDGTWTDNTENTPITPNAIYSTNTPGDGRWDQSAIPSPVELQVGRIDMYNMPSFALSEVDLIRQYFSKNHLFRHKIVNPARKALLNPHLDHMTINTSAVGWRSFSPLVGPDQIDVVDTNGCGTNCPAFIDTLEGNSYLWTYVAGGGTDNSVGGQVFSSNYCISRTLNTVFLQLYGSYLVEWAKGSVTSATDNLFRATIANDGMTLATCWTGGSPRWYFHHMAMGESIGFSTMQSQNNTTIYDPGNVQNLGGIHMVLMGDPTLRMHMVFPVSNLIINQDANGLKLDWTASTDSQILGYNVYRSDTITGDFIRLNTSPVAATSYSDLTPSFTENNVYMVRALKFEDSPSGTYQNMSTGIIAESFYSPTLAVKLLSFHGTLIDGSVKLFWTTATETNNDHFEIEKSYDGITFFKLADVNGNGTKDSESNYSLSDKNVLAAQIYYKLKQVDFNGQFEYFETIVIENDKLSSAIKIYPNPAKELFTLEFPYPSAATEIIIFDLNGREVLHVENIENRIVEINISGLVQGTYAIKFIYRNHVSFSKLIKK